MAPNTKGGGPRGGPKRWTGGGPRPARHIPWPEIFKHHISVVEGHLKMLEMIKKHTTPETGNWRSICTMVDRSYDMLRMAKDATRNFAPPSNQREQVPIGSSSASMYPGYSPADHEYGKAAFEYGLAVAAARAEGVDFRPGQDPNGPEYVIGQAKGEKRKTLAQIKAEKAAASGSRSGSGSDTRNPGGPSRNQPMDGNAKDAGRSSEPASGDNPYFVIDTNPTPVQLPGMPNGHAKRASTKPAPSEPTEETKSKRIKTKHTDSGEETKVEIEDISEEVDARLKEKEEKRKRKEEKKKKRKREVEGSSG
ncbi:MAG: hypothetical protein M1830_007472, partial [Pleopsidium flavum]